MATRYSGEVVIRVQWVDRIHGNCPHGGHYKTSVSVRGKHVWSGVVCAPASLPRGQGVDSPKAYDDTAHAALSFADDETRPDYGGRRGSSDIGDVAAYDIEGRGWHIGRSPTQAWPRAPNAQRGRRAASTSGRERYVVVWGSSVRNQEVSEISFPSRAKANAWARRNIRGAYVVRLAKGRY